MAAGLDITRRTKGVTIGSRSRSILRSMLVGVSWGLGHTLVLFIVGFGALVLKLTIPDKLALSMEFVVGIVLVLLGVPLVKRLFRDGVHVHWHRYGDTGHFHGHSHDVSPQDDHCHVRRPLLIGMVHGLAGSGAFTLLVLSSMPSVLQGMVFLLLFGVGSILGMLLFSGVIGLPFKLAAGVSARLNLWVQGAAGTVSIFRLFYHVGNRSRSGTVCLYRLMVSTTHLICS